MLFSADVLMKEIVHNVLFIFFIATDDNMWKSIYHRLRYQCSLIAGLLGPMALSIFRFFSLQKNPQSVGSYAICEKCTVKNSPNPEKWIFNLGFGGNISRAVRNFKFPPLQLCMSMGRTGSKKWSIP